MNDIEMKTLGQIVNKVSYDKIERKLYSHDIAAMPALVKPLLGKTLADAVVQPESEEDIVQLIHWANQYDVALTPRGKATSGYGGVLPVNNGVVVDFYSMKSVLEIDSESLVVRTQPGITWEKLDRELKKQDLTLRLYPSSYPSATVGGWLAQGGAGFGSYEYGFIHQSVISARVVLPNGDVKVFEGDDLDLIAEAEGITGLISEVSLKVQKNIPLDIVSIGCEKPEDFQELVDGVIEKDLPVWSIMFINPKMAELKNQAPQQEHFGHPVEEHVELPESYIVTIASRQGETKKVVAGIQSIISDKSCAFLSEKIADHEWKNRFKLMTVKRLGPSLVPAEVIVPLRNLAPALKEIEEKVGLPIVKEGVIVRDGRDGEPEVVILGFIPSDERKFGYNFAFALSLTVFKIAEKHGGRGYSSGLYFTSKAEAIHGKDKIQRIRKFKKEVDKKSILNPGKVIDSGLVSTFLNLASAVEPVARAFGNSVNVEIGERIENSKRGIPGDVIWYAYACSQCGYCVDECDQFYGRGWESQSPRGKWFWLREYVEGKEQWNQKMVDSFIACTTCEICNNRCSAALPIESSWMKIRGKTIHEDERMTFPPFYMMAEATKAEGNIWAGYRKNRDAWFPEDLREKHAEPVKSDMVYFAGCTASFVEEDIGIASVRILDEAGVDFTYVGKKENCCGTPMLVSGKWDVFEDTVKKNIAAIKAVGGKTVVTSCPACDMMWRHVYPKWAEKLGLDYDIESKHYSEVIAEKIESEGFEFPENNWPEQTVTWHDSCHMGRVSKIYEEPRKVIQSIPNVNYVEMEFNREEAHCCGSVLTLIKDPPEAHEIGKIRLDEAIEAGAQKVLAACPCCEFQFRVSADKKDLPIEVVDLASFCASALGYELPDPHPEVKAQWAVFEAMIALMTPEGFAELMGTMWPEMIDAMPFGMGGMMRFMGKNIPWSLSLMKPMFPVLFPVLLPMMMPKVMEPMLVRVADKIPMPDYMAEQMPDLMPNVMDQLMPHMIGDVVPLVTEPMIQYLKMNGKP